MIAPLLTGLLMVQFVPVSRSSLFTDAELLKPITLAHHLAEGAEIRVEEKGSEIIREVKPRRDWEYAASLLSTEEARYAVMTTLVAQVAQAYLSLRTLDLTLEISKRTVTSREQSGDLVQARLDGGVAGILDLRQAETLLYSATKTIPEIQRLIEQTENFISILLGRNPGPIKRGRPLGQQVAVPTVPAGLPSELLARRPDIRGAEQLLVSANAQIGVAKALLFPQVTISGFAGAGRAVISGSTFGP